jgi:hypothetical protein
MTHISVTSEVILEFPEAPCYTSITENFILMVKFVIHTWVSGRIHHPALKLDDGPVRFPVISIGIDSIILQDVFEIERALLTWLLITSFSQVVLEISETPRARQQVSGLSNHFRSPLPIYYGNFSSD